MNTQMPTINIYALVDPDSLTVNYVGATTLELKIRKSAHISNAKRKSCAPVYMWLFDLLKNGKKPKIVLLERTRCSYKEFYWIQYFLRIGHPIKNRAMTGLHGSPYDRQKNSDDLLKEFFKCSNKMKTKRLKKIMEAA